MIRLRYLNPWFWMRKTLPRTLFARSLLIIVVPALLVQIVTTIVFVDNHWRKVSSRLAFALAGEISIMVQEMEEGRDRARFEDLKRYASQSLDLLVTFEPNRELIPGIETSGTWEPFTAEALSHALEQQVRKPYSIALDPDDEWINIGIQMDQGILRVFALERRIFSSSAYIFLMWLVGSSIILFAIAVIFMRNQIRPILRLAVAAERFGVGRDIAHFKPEGAREVRTAARAFLDMHERIKRQMEQRTAMLAGISHDLRTPLTRMKLALAIMPENDDTHALKSDVSDMERMINSYLDFVRGEEKESAQRVDLVNIFDKFMHTVQRSGKNMTVKFDGDTSIIVRPIAFERALQNIVSNAEKYGDMIDVSIVNHGDLMDIVIDDDGPGLDEKYYDDVFKPFFRVDASRSIDSGSVGLGLPIAQDIILAHGGRIWLDQSPSGGLRACIQLPV
jgi:two-component system, OmpR family, osmolarity sensor histidine kinase EnvZ